LRCKLDYFEEEEETEENKNEERKKTNKGKCNGPIKPNITFFGEPLPGDFYDAWYKI